MHENQANNHAVPEPSDENVALPPHLKGRELWRSLEHLAQTDEFKEFAEREFQEGAQILDGEDRRQFMKVMGASFALAGLAGAACRRLPESKIAPYAHRPADRMPGVPVDYATNFELGGVATGVRARSYDGRPINLEGNGLHPGSSHACGVMAQATVLALYDPDRLRVLKRKGDPSDWDTFEKWMTERCASHAKNGGGSGLAVLSRATSGPSMDRMKARFKSTFPSATWTEWEAVNDDNAYLGSGTAFGAYFRAHPKLESAEVVVSLGADFMGTEVNSMVNATNWSKRRHLEGLPAQASMSRVYQFEPMLTVTGMAADERISVRASDMSDLAALFLARLGGGKIDTSTIEKSLRDSTNRAFVDADGSDVSLSDLAVFEKAASDLDEHRGRCLVLAGEGQPPAVHAAAALLNQALGNVGKTVTYTSLEKRPTRVAALGALAKALDAGTMKTLVMFDVDPAYDAPADFKFADAMAKAEEVVYVGTHMNKTNASDACKWIVPGTHYLEAWGDTRSYEGTIGIVQPLIYPLVDDSQGGRSALELVALMSSDKTTDGLAIVRETASQRYGTSEYAFERRWRAALSSGFEAKTSTPPAAAPTANPSSVFGALKESMSDMRSRGGTNDVELMLYHDVKVYDGRFGNVGWMQELPDPVTKLTWDNALLMGPVFAEAKGLKTGDMVELKTPAGSMKAAVMLMPGFAANTCALSIGYGQGKDAGAIADGAGFDVYPLRKSNGMNLVQKVSIALQGEVYPLAHTQDHGTAGALIREVVQDGIQERLPSIVREGSLEMYRENPGFAHGAAHVAHRLSLWEETNLDGARFRWAMSIDLSSCTGCSACVTACQAENNVAVVGKDQVLRGREMHWIRIDRYFKGGSVVRPEQVVTQPVTCQHCENAPCEQVCPVAATVHDKDGLNVMVYNRCIGTRYCSNNCPYKVRRFNFFDYNRRDPVRSQDGIWAVKADYYTSDGPNEWRRMQFNPEVTVRSRGVMEKCSFCVQRINAAKIKYKNAWARAGGGANENARNWHIPDGAIVTACQHACPTNAIVFGDLNDPESRVSKLQADLRTYDLLGELNTKPRLKYMAKVSNPSAARGVFSSGGHGGHGDHGDSGHDHDDHAGRDSAPNATEVRT